MTKVLKILARLALAFIEIALVLVICLAFLIRLPDFQTFLAKKGAHYASEFLEVPVGIERVEIVFLDRIYLHAVYIEDQHEDTLGYIDELFLNINWFSVFDKQFELDEVTLNRPVFKLKRYSEDENLNIQFLLDVFKSEKEPKPIDFVINSGRFNLIDGHFVFEDQHKPMKDFGVDYAHMNLKQINLTAEYVKIRPTDYAASIQHLSFTDRSGLVINSFSGDAFFSNKGLKLTQAQILTPQSELHLEDFLMTTQNYKSYKEFIDEVPLQMEIAPSSISMLDVALFAPALEGMDEQFTLHGNTANTISEFAITELHLAFMNSHVEGDFFLPDFRSSPLVLDQNIKSFDIQLDNISQFKLPSSVSNQTIALPSQVANLQRISGKNLGLSGDLNSLTVDLRTLHTGAGSIHFSSPLLVTDITTDRPIIIKNTASDKRFIRFDQFDLGKVLALNDFGIINGKLGFETELAANSHVRLSNVEGGFERFALMGYSYKNIQLFKVNVDVDLKKKITETKIDGLVYVRDQNLDLVYNGKTTFGESMIFDVALDIECANLNKLHPSLAGRGELVTTMKLNGKGKDMETFTGEIVMNRTTYSEGDEDFYVDYFDAKLERKDGNDRLVLHSDIVDAQLTGYVDLDVVLDNMIYQASLVFPAFFTDVDPVFDLNSKFSYEFDIKEVNDVLAVFYSPLKIADHTLISGSYNGQRNYFDLNVKSDYIQHDDARFNKVMVFQELNKGQLLALYRTEGIYWKDSMVAQRVNFTNIASNSFMDSHLIFYDKTESRSNVEWNTYLFEANSFNIDILPSYFNINNHRWDLTKEAYLNYTDDCFNIDGLMLARDDQYILLNGQVSSHPADALTIQVNNLDLADLAVLLTPDNDVSGRGNMSGVIREPFTELKFTGTTEINDLFIDKREIGDINFDAFFNAEVRAIAMEGELIYRRNKTFNFTGDYYLRESDNLDLMMNFNQTDIGVLNSFLDPKVVSGIRGDLNGGLKLTGSFNQPNLNGKIRLNKGGGKLALLGADFNYEGDIVSNDFGIFINTMPVSDEEGNTGFIVGHLFHDNFTNLMYELTFNFEDHPTKRNPLNRSEPLKLDRFLVMKTVYSEESLYYGNAYMTGSASISGVEKDMSINVNAKTRRGTWINFPMYGPTTLEDDGFIRFKSTEAIDSIMEETGIDFTGVNLSLDFEVTPDARVKLIFDENIGDEITAYGRGNLKIDLDNYGDIALNGTYTVTDGVYNFAMGPYKQNFFISPGGTVQWTGSPYRANLDIETYYKTNANLSVVMADVIEGRTSDNEEIYSYLRLRGDMNKPEISFDLAAPKATDAGKAVINRIRSDKDELNRQFFSILITKRFQPLAGQEGRASASGGGALDLVSTQINSLLSKVSDDYKMNVALDSDELTGESSVEFGVTKGFLDDRLIVSGSFGVGSQNQANANQNNLIGDVRVEYLLNDRGTFRVNAFNVSNANSVIQNTNQGQFTQGVGINYREDFHNLRDFKAFQFIADMFRKNKRLNYRDMSKYQAIPDEYRNKFKAEQEAAKKERE